MRREAVSTSNAPAAVGPYSQAMIAEGKLLFLSGQIPLTPTGDMVTGAPGTQARQCLTNLKAVLESQGLTMDHIVKTTILLTSMEAFAEVNQVYAEFFTGAPPARATFAVSGLPRGADVEIEAVAVF
jgi:2-iminobutanoate/2-iminopropanoate deaminase